MEIRVSCFDLPLGYLKESVFRIALVVTHTTIPEAKSTTLSTRLDIMAMDPDKTAAASLAASKTYTKANVIRI
jgi:hypothetical protein